MRSVMIAFVAAGAIVAGVAAGISPAGAQSSFFNKRFCTFGGGGRSGSPDCSYSTWEQCRASATGLGRYCAENPNWTRSQDERAPRRARRNG
jgi:hypothetical protein